MHGSAICCYSAVKEWRERGSYKYLLTQASIFLFTPLQLSWFRLIQLCPLSLIMILVMMMHRSPVHINSSYLHPSVPRLSAYIGRSHTLSNWSKRIKNKDRFVKKKKFIETSTHVELRNKSRNIPFLISWITSIDCVCVCVCFDVGWISGWVLKKSEKKRRIEGGWYRLLRSQEWGALYCISTMAPSQQKCKRVVEWEGVLKGERERTREGDGARERDGQSGRDGGKG